MSADWGRVRLKRALAAPVPRAPASGVTILTYHRVGGGTADEMDVAAGAFAAQLDILASHDVLPLDDALDRLLAGDGRPAVVLTFDDGFQDFYLHGWPLLAARRLPFTLFLATAFVGDELSWSRPRPGAAPALALEWGAVAQMVASGLCTVGNHTHDHVVPAKLTMETVDACTTAVEAHLGVTPRHFAFPWGIAVPAAEAGLRVRFRSAVTGTIGRNLPGADLYRLARVPVRRTDPLPFFKAKLAGRLIPERAYGGVVAAAKRLGASA